MGFPKDFVWGSATSSYQIEGAALEDGRSECVWHHYAHTPGNVYNNDNGDVACDHYHRYREDVALMAGLGLNAYRFSTSWARVLPQGIGTPNPAGLDFYDRLVDELLKYNIRPFATLYHWDMPQVLEDRGGWTHPDSVLWFRDYADLMARRLGDRVKDWITHNEPWVVAFLGHLMGRFPPAKHDPALAFKAAHHLLLSHGAAVPVIRQNCPGAEVGITLNVSWFEPYTSAQADVAAARREESFINRWFCEPVFKGHYPQDVVLWMQGALQDIDLDSVKQAAVPIDFLGLNYYFRTVVAADENSPIGSRHVRMEGSSYTATNWEVYPDGLRQVLARLSEEYAPPAFYITENGAAYDDPEPAGEVVEDPERTAYYQGHWKACEEAVAQGIPLKGYFAWSLMDNFEWSHGYSKRFGIVYTDYRTLARIPKRSALAYRDMIARWKANQ